jgi:two-component system, sensor histidine kinase and response regulator
MEAQIDKPLALVVDDEPINVKLIGKTISTYCTVKVATNGRKALESAFSAPHPDLILLDIMMPEMNGYDVCKKLKEAPETKNIPIIFLTALSGEEDEARGFELGAVDYIVKPFNPLIVKARVKTQLQLKTQHDQLKLQHNQLKSQHEQLKKASELRADVERITRHDLKSPLNGVIGFSSILKNSENLDDEELEMTQIIEDSGYRMLNMINLSLNLYQMEQGTYKLNAEPINILSVIKKITTVQAKLMADNNLDLKIFVNNEELTQTSIFMLRAEELLCYTMFANIFKNAIEASPKKSTITIHINNESDQGKIVIHNQGAVPQEIKEIFFNKYATSGKTGGTGLGTYSARLIARTQNGDIAMSSSVEGGTTITVYLPKD